MGMGVSGTEEDEVACAEASCLDVLCVTQR